MRTELSALVTAALQPTRGMLELLRFKGRRYIGRGLAYAIAIDAVREGARGPLWYTRFCHNLQHVSSEVCTRAARGVDTPARMVLVLLAPTRCHRRQPVAASLHRRRANSVVRVYAHTRTRHDTWARRRALGSGACRRLGGWIGTNRCGRKCNVAQAGGKVGTVGLPRRLGRPVRSRVCPSHPAGSSVASRDPSIAVTWHRDCECALRARRLR